MAKVLLTGGAGFIGSHLVHRLVTDGHTVTVWDNMSTGKRGNLPPDVKVYEIDVANVTPMYHDKRYEIIFHLAGFAHIEPSFANPLLAFHANVVSTQKALEIARLHASRFIYAGSGCYQNVYAQPCDFTKWQGEELCKLYNCAYGVSTAIARFSNVYGPSHGEDVIAVFEKQRREGQSLTVTGDGQQRRDFCHVDDIVEGLVRISTTLWQADVFHLCSGINYSINEVARMFKPKEIVHIAKQQGSVNGVLTSCSQQKLAWTPRQKLSDYVSQFLLTLNSL